jgi:hypothetical protein
MALGGIIIPAPQINKVVETMGNYRQQYNMHSELKWSKVKRQKIEQYKKFVEYFFALCNTDKAHFKSLIIDNHKVDHKKYNDGDKEKGFYKFYYQLLFNCFGRKYYNRNEDNVKFIVHPDERTTSYSLDELKEILNRGMSKYFGKQIRPFVAIEPKESHKSEITQINDILLGAIGFQKNGYNLVAGSAQGKIELAEFIATCAGLNTLTETTKYGWERFSIWNFQLR